VPVVELDAKENDHDLSKCYGYGNTLADSWFMRMCGHAIAVNPEPSLRTFAEQNKWEIVEWP
jgi:phosphoserine phosphatase